MSRDGKINLRVSTPRSTTPPLLLHFSAGLRGAVVKLERIFKDRSGCDWMGWLMKLDKHKKYVAQETNGCYLTFISDKTHSLQRRPQDWPWLIHHRRFTRRRRQKCRFGRCLQNLGIHLSSAYLCRATRGIFVISDALLIQDTNEMRSYLHSSHFEVNSVGLWVPPWLLFIDNVCS